MKKVLLLMLCFMSVLNAAALTSGYYKIYNAGYSRYMYEDFTSNVISTTTSFAGTDYEKIWYISVSGTTVTLKNAYTGNYAQQQSTTSAQFTTGSSSANFTLTSNSDGTYMFNGGSYMHCASSQSYNIVNWWDSSSTYSMWTVESVTVDATALATAQAEYTAAQSINTNASTINTNLLKIFTDASCTQLKSSYASDAALTTAMKNAGITNTGLQNVALNIKNSWSGETNSDVASTFRIREYQAYTPAWRPRQKLNATQFTDLNNPTGIYANAKDVLYVFVGGTIPDGCSLRMVGLTGNSQASYAAGIELKEGVNAIMASADFSHMWIMYTYTSDTQVDMSTLDKLKIHIEGGTVYGFADVTDQDETAANATYMTALKAANTAATAKSADTSSLNFVVKGNRGVFYFPLTTYNQIWQTSAYNSNNYTTNYNIYKSIHWFDNVLAWEWGIMGFTKRVYDGKTDEHEHVTGGKSIYPTYCNNLALTLQGSGNPFSTTGYTSMPGVGGVESSYNAEREDFDNWCVGHESGHNNQGAINLPSSTESSNNLFSNVVCYLHGYRMSRGEPVSTTNSDYQSGTQFALRDIGSTHRMYWQLYLYYHEAQHKTSFYPELFESLRNDPMDLSTGECFLKFYEKVCDAAGEDLTEFFRGWGFFVPFENQVFGDYTSRTLTLTQSQIDAAIASVKDKYSTENTAIMFIEDRINESYRWDAWADGATDVRAVQSHAVGTCGDIGSVTDYEPSSTTVTAANYTSYTLSGNTITMNGTGGVGFLVYDAEGNLVAFSNSTSFTIPESAVVAGFTVKVVNADNSSAEVKSVAESGTDAEKLAALQAVIATAKSIVDSADDTNTKVGYYKASAVETLSDALTRAQAVVSAGTTTSYGDMITLLNQELATLALNEHAKTQLVSGNYYSLRNVYYPTRYASISSNALTTTTSSTLADTEKWELTSAGNDQWYIKNKSTGQYVSTLGTSTQATAAATTTDAAFKFNVEEYSDGIYALNSNASEGYKYLHCASNDNYKIVGWTYGADASHWYITLAEETEEGAANSALQEIIDKTQNLLNSCTSDYTVPGSEIALTTTSGQSGYITTNAQETSEGDIANLIDASTTSFFHSTWSAAGPSGNHYIQVDLADETIDQFSFSFMNRVNSNNSAYTGYNSPTNIIITGSNDGTTWTAIKTLTTSDGLPTTTGSQSTFTSGTLGTSGTSYRYLRFTVTATNTGGNTSAGYPYFALSDFKLYRASADFTPATGYESIDETAVTDAITELGTAESTLDSGTTAEKTAEATELQTAYDALLAAVQAAVKDPLREQLQELIDKTNTLISTAVEDGYTYEAITGTNELTLQTTSSSTTGYLTTNHQETKEGPIEYMIDGNSTTFFHSTWSTATTDKHYWQVDLVDQTIGEFIFSITSRNNNPNNFPSDITVSGSNDGTNFTEIENVTNSLGTSGLVTYTSDVLGSNDTPYRYLRFTVNKTGSGNGNNSNATYYFFALSDFTLLQETTRSFDGTKKTGYTNLDDDLLINAAAGKDDASDLISDANYSKSTVAQLQTHYETLLAAYNALLAAMQRGDVNLDGKVDVTDVATLVGVLQGTYTGSYGVTDIDADGDVDSDDVTSLTSIILCK